MAWMDAFWPYLIVISGTVRLFAIVNMNFYIVFMIVDRIMCE
jgi:hypothetical protein